MTLGDILGQPGPTLEVSGLTADSRKVAAGDVFFALAGAKDDGLKHVAQALQRGARAIVA